MARDDFHGTGEVERLIECIDGVASSVGVLADDIRKLERKQSLDSQTANGVVVFGFVVSFMFSLATLIVVLCK